MRAVLAVLAILAAGSAQAGLTSDYQCKVGKTPVRVHAVIGDIEGEHGFLQIGDKRAPLKYRGTGGTESGVLIYVSDLSDEDYNWVLLDDAGANFKIKNREVICPEK